MKIARNHEWGHSEWVFEGKRYLVREKHIWMIAVRIFEMWWDK